MVALAAASVSEAAQDRFESGDLKGFTRSPTEHIIIELEERHVQRVEGIVCK
jgi:hypothetical protein